MDENRQIRFLIPPFLFILSLFLGDLFSCSNYISKIASQSDKTIIAIIVALGASAIPLGYLISSVPIALLNLIGDVLNCYYKKKKIKRRCYYEIGLRDSILKKIWHQLDIYRPFDYRKKFYIGVTFDHGIVSERIHAWLVRRWNAFNINISCFFALILSHLIGVIFLSISSTSKWWITTIIFSIIFCYNAFVAWKQTMNMIEFQALRKINKISANESDIGS